MAKLVLDKIHRITANTGETFYTDDILKAHSLCQLKIVVKVEEVDFTEVSKEDFTTEIALAVQKHKEKHEKEKDMAEIQRLKKKWDLE